MGFDMAAEIFLVHSTQIASPLDHSIDLNRCRRFRLVWRRHLSEVKPGGLEWPEIEGHVLKLTGWPSEELFEWIRRSLGIAL
jgi:hypothetical protein